MGPQLRPSGRPPNGQQVRKLDLPEVPARTPSLLFMAAAKMWNFWRGPKIKTDFHAGLIDGSFPSLSEMLRLVGMGVRLDGHKWAMVRLVASVPSGFTRQRGWERKQQTRAKTTASLLVRLSVKTMQSTIGQCQHGGNVKISHSYVSSKINAAALR